ncbi:MAG: hypothetical protein ACOX0W_02675 [Sphaerochaetaceae bacterium]|jgi:quercetin dioxygenase-like cupin family protein
MIETLYQYTTGDVDSVERIVKQDNLQINHLSLVEGGSVDPHTTAEAAHMIITRGVLGLKLNDQKRKEFPVGSIVAIPENTLLDITNAGKGTMHLFVIKTE